MLDHVSVHVDDPQRSIGSRSYHHRTTPTVFAGEEVGPRLGGIATELEAHVVFSNQVVLHQIVKGLACERVLFRAPRSNSKSSR